MSLYSATHGTPPTGARRRGHRRRHRRRPAAARDPAARRPSRGAGASSAAPTCGSVRASSSAGPGRSAPGPPATSWPTATPRRCSSTTPTASARPPSCASLGERATAVDEPDPSDVDLVLLAAPVAPARGGGPHAPWPPGGTSCRWPTASVAVEGLLDLHAEARERGVVVAVGAGFGPGLSCVLARHAAGDSRRRSTRSTSPTTAPAGPACARQHHGALRGVGLDWRDHAWRRRPPGSGRELCFFPDPIGGSDCYRAGLPDALLLVPAFPAASRVTARLAATRRDRFTAGLPMLRPPHAEGRIGGLRVEVRGRRGQARDTVVLGAGRPPRGGGGHRGRGDGPLGRDRPGADDRGRGAGVAGRAAAVPARAGPGRRAGGGVRGRLTGGRAVCPYDRERRADSARPRPGRPGQPLGSLAVLRRLSPRSWPLSLARRGRCVRRRRRRRRLGVGPEASSDARTVSGGEPIGPADEGIDGVEAFRVDSNDHTEENLDLRPSAPDGRRALPGARDLRVLRVRPAARRAARARPRARRGLDRLRPRPRRRPRSRRSAPWSPSRPRSPRRPYPDLSSPLVVTAWARQLELDSVDDPRLLQFIDTYRNSDERPRAHRRLPGRRHSPRSPSPRRERRPRVSTVTCVAPVGQQPLVAEHLGPSVLRAVPQQQQQVGRRAPHGHVALGVLVLEPSPLGAERDQPLAARLVAASSGSVACRCIVWPVRPRSPVPATAAHLEQLVDAVDRQVGADRRGRRRPPTSASTRCSAVSIGHAPGPEDGGLVGRPRSPPARRGRQPAPRWPATSSPGRPGPSRPRRRPPGPARARAASPVATHPAVHR